MASLAPDCICLHHGLRYRNCPVPFIHCLWKVFKEKVVFFTVCISLQNILSFARQVILKTIKKYKVLLIRFQSNRKQINVSLTYKIGRIHHREFHFNTLILKKYLYAHALSRI